MEDKCINKILNFSDENINNAEELIINKEQAKHIINELQDDYIPKAIVNFNIFELKSKQKYCSAEEFRMYQYQIDILTKLLKNEEV